MHGESHSKTPCASEYYPLIIHGRKTRTTSSPPLSPHTHPSLASSGYLPLKPLDLILRVTLQLHSHREFLSGAPFSLSEPPQSIRHEFIPGTSVGVRAPCPLPRALPSTPCKRVAVRSAALSSIHPSSPIPFPAVELRILRACAKFRAS